MTIRPLSAPPSRIPAPAPKAPPPQAPKDVPPELKLEPPAPPEPPRSLARRVGLHVALGLSVVGVAAPLVQQAVQVAAASRAAEAVTAKAQPVTVRPDVPAALLPTPEVPASWARLSPDGGHVLLRSHERAGGMALVNTADGRAEVRWDGAGNGATFLGSDRVVIWTSDGNVQLRDRTGKLLSQVPAPTLRGEPSVAGDRLAYSDEKELHLLRLQDGELKEVRVESRGSRVASWSADRVAVIQDRGYDSADRLQVLDSRDGRVLLDQELDREDRSVQLTPDGERVLVAGDRRDSRWGGHVRMLGPDGGTVWERRGFSTAVLSPDGGAVVLGGSGSPARTQLVDARTGKSLWEVPGAGYNLRFSSDGSRLFATSGDALVARDASSGAVLWARGASNSPTLALSADGKVAVGDWVQKEQKWFVSLLDGADGRVLAQQPAAGRLQSLAFSADGQRLLIQGEQGYGTTQIQLVDVARSPFDQAAHARAEAREVLGRMVDRGGVPEGLDTVPVHVLRALESGGARIVRAGLEGPQPATLDVAATFADPGALRERADRALAQADARHGERIAQLEARLEKARDEARQKGNAPVALGDLLAGKLDPTSLDPDVQRAASELFHARQARNADAWGALEGSPLEPASARGGLLDARAAAAAASRPVTLEELARAHGASTPSDTKRFVDLAVALNGPRLGQARQRYLDSVKQIYPEAGLTSLPLERQPFLVSQADLVLPSYHHHGGRTISGRDLGALQAWQEGSRAVVLDGRVVVLGEGGNAREALGRAYEAVLREKDPQFFQDFSRRWRDDWWSAHRWGEGAATASDHFARRFAEFTGPGRAELEGKNANTARLVQIAVDAAPRVAK